MKFVPIIIYLLFTSSVFSQYKTIHISNSEGMTNSSVNCLFEDSENILWLGTWDGLNSYNGRDIKNYRHSRKNEYSISNNIVHQIIGQDSFNIWITTDNGINRLNKKNQQFSRFFEGQSGFIMAMTSDKTPLCYVNNDGLYYFKEAEQVFAKINYDIDKNIDTNDVNNLATDSKNNLYLLNRDGVLKKYRINKKNGEVRIGHSIIVDENKSISNIFVTPDRLIINYSSFLKIVNTNTYKEYKIALPEGKNINNVVCLNNLIYIHYNNNEFVQYDIAEKKFIEIKEISKQFPVFSMCAGTQNILWIGSDGQGAIGVYENSSPFKALMMDATVRCFAEENNKYIWVGTKGDGIKFVNKETKEIEKTITQANGLSSNSIYTLKKNKWGDIFVGSDGLGIDIISSQHPIRHLIIPKGMSVPKNVYSILFTNDSLLWVGTAGNGLYKMNIYKKNGTYFAKDVKRFLSEKKPNAINNNTIYSIAKNKSNDDLLWIGTRGGGVNIFEISSNKFVNLESLGSDISLSSNDVLCLFSDINDNLWIGTSYGLNQLITKYPYRIIDYSKRDEFVNNTIHGILEDSLGNLWLSTNQGILNLNTQTGKISHYTVYNGLHSNEFSDGSCYLGKNMEFFFGGIKGYSYFNANDVHFRSYSPKMSLYNLQINNTNQNIYDRVKNNILNLSYNEPYLTLTFIANDFINNKNCEYSYRIKGFANEWIYNGKQPNIIITKLPSGKYDLEVKCSNGDGIWNDNIYTLGINVGYPWWRSNIAYCIYLFVFVAIIYISVLITKNRIRLRKQILLEHMEKEHQVRIHESKLDFFTNVAHEFFTPLTLIYTPAQLLLERAENDSFSKKYLRIIKNNADRMQKLINELMEFRKIESGYITLHPEVVDIKQMIEYIADNYVEIIKLNNITLDIRFGNVSKLITDRVSFDKILFNLISNAFKYTPSGETISIYADQNINDNSLVFKIKNYGVGLTEKQMNDIFNRFKIFEKSKMQNSFANGIGLNLTKNLVELLGGTISVDSQIYKYVEFKAVLPMLQFNDIDKNGSMPFITKEQKTLTPDINLSERKKKISILIVEDEKDIRELLRDILSPYYIIYEATDGVQALKKVEINIPNIIISDILMPNMDGINFIDHLKSDLKTSHIPIISISAKNAIEDHINAFKHGADLYIGKPFNSYHVLTTIENIIEKFSILQQYFNSNRSSVLVRDGVELNSEDEKFIHDIIIYIENNIDNESLNPIAISDYLNISKTIFYERLKKATGKTPSEFIKIIRLEYASKLLKTTQLTTSEIIYKSGFSSRSYFYREFAKHFNMSLAEYKKTEG